MYKTFLTMMLGMILTGCGDGKAPRLAIFNNSDQASNETAERPTKGGDHASLVVRRKPPKGAGMSYGGRTVDKWGEILTSAKDRDTIREACRALSVLGAEGRPQLIRGLESSHPEVRFLCLAHLTPSDLKGDGEEGRQLLVKLAGDIKDMRIRERAAQYLAMWDRAVPSR